MITSRAFHRHQQVADVTFTDRLTQPGDRGVKPRAGMFNHRRRLLHDMLVGTIVINNPVRVQGLRPREAPWNG